MVFCRKALGEGDHVHLSGLGSLFLVIMTAQAVIIGLGWSPETTLRRCRRRPPAATELEEREQGSQPAKKWKWVGGARVGPCAPHALCPVPLGFSGGLAPAGRWRRSSARGRRRGRDARWRSLLRETSCDGFHSPPPPTPTSPPPTHPHRILQAPCCRALMMILAMLAG